MGFIQNTSDPSIYTSLKEETFVIAVCVDDTILAGKTDKGIREAKEALAKSFKSQGYGRSSLFLGSNNHTKS